MKKTLASHVNNCWELAISHGLACGFAIHATGEPQPSRIADKFNWDDAVHAARGLFWHYDLRVVAGRMGALCSIGRCESKPMVMLYLPYLYRQGWLAHFRRLSIFSLSGEARSSLPFFLRDNNIEKQHEKLAMLSTAHTVELLSPLWHPYVQLLPLPKGHHYHHYHRAW